MLIFLEQDPVILKEISTNYLAPCFVLISLFSKIILTLISTLEAVDVISHANVISLEITILIFQRWA